MQCPYCTSTEICVLESRIADEGSSIRRRRACNSCSKRFTTYERIEGIDLFVLKKDGSLEPFDRNKIHRGLVKATWKRPVKIEEIESIVDEVERDLRTRSNTTIKSWEIGKMVIQRLRELDPLGYLLFASVYRDFETLEDFRDEIDALLAT